MALWLFRRKSRRKRGRASTSLEISGQQLPAPPRSFTVPENAVAARASASLRRRRSANKKQRAEPNKLHRRARTYSFESGRADTLEVGNAGVLQHAGRRTTKRAAPLPQHASAALVGHNSHGSLVNKNNNDNDNDGNINGSYQDDTNPQGDVYRSPTLYHPNKRSGQELLPRTKSSKRRKNAHNREREAEIKAMSNGDVYNHHDDNFTPVRPAAELWTAGRPMKRETIKANGNSGFGTRHGKDKEQQRSDVSLPIAGSIDSAMSSDSEQVAYIISPFAALAPKPTLRYASHGHSGPPSGGSFPKRLPSQKRKLSQPIPEATLKAHKRVDDLANDMDASDLRELMERDKRRRERKRQHDEERAERRLARQAERQQPSDAQVPGGAAGPPANLSRGVLGRDAAVGLGIDSATSAVVTSSTRRQSPPSSTLSSRRSPEHEEPQQWREDGQQQDEVHAPLHGSSAASIGGSKANYEQTASVSGGEASLRRRPSPVDMFHRPDSIPMAPTGVDLPMATIQTTRTTETMPGNEKHRDSSPIPARANSTLRRLARLRKRLSNSSSLAERRSLGRSDVPVTQRTLHSASSRGPLSWGSLGAIFRWTAKQKRGSGPSSFSNVSRDSMAAQSSIQRSQHMTDSTSQFQLQPQSQVPGSGAAAAATTSLAGAGGGHALKAKSSLPKRTLSRFREDLPDFLLSPPDSRLQSPEAEIPALPALPKQDAQPHNYPAAEQEMPFVHDTHNGADYDDESVIATPIAFHTNQQQAQSLDDNHSIGNSGNSVSFGTRETPTSWLQMDDADASPEPQQSLSLASIDSEASWLSGRVAGRQRQTQPQRSLDSVSHSYQQQQQQQQQLPLQPPLSPVSASLILAANAVMSASASSPTDEEIAGLVADDEYLNRIAEHGHGAGTKLSRQRMSTADSETRPASDEEMDDVDDDARWGSVTERKVATVAPAHPVANVMKSQEGLMKSFYDGEDGNGGDSPVSPVSPVSQASSGFKDEDEVEAGLQRATSVRLSRGHARHISAGSAKLLDLSPRNSVDAKRRSMEPLF